VGSGNAIEAISSGGAPEECVAGTASGSFDRKVKTSGEGGDIAGFDGRVERELGSEGGDKCSIGLRVRTAKIVVEVEDEGHYTELGSERGESSQQGYGVSAATNGDADALAGTD